MATVSAKDSAFHHMIPKPTTAVNCMFVHAVEADRIFKFTVQSHHWNYITIWKRPTGLLTTNHIKQTVPVDLCDIFAARK